MQEDPALPLSPQCFTKSENVWGYKRQSIQSPYYHTYKKVKYRGYFTSEQTKKRVLSSPKYLGTWLNSPERNNTVVPLYSTTSPMRSKSPCFPSTLTSYESQKCLPSSYKPTSPLYDPFIEVPKSMPSYDNTSRNTMEFQSRVPTYTKGGYWAYTPSKSTPSKYTPSEPKPTVSSAAEKHSQMKSYPGIYDKKTSDTNVVKETSDTNVVSSQSKYCECKSVQSKSVQSKSVQSKSYQNVSTQTELCQSVTSQNKKKSCQTTTSCRINKANPTNSSHSNESNRTKSRHKYAHCKKGPEPSAGVINIQTDCSEFTAKFGNTSKIRRLLEEEGFAIITDVLNADECKDIIDGVWDSMEKITAGLDVPVNRKKKETWSSVKQQEKLRDIYSHHGIAHAEFLWRLRQKPKILSIFCDAYGGDCRPEDLLVSFDGLSFQTPPEYNKRGNGWYKNCWYHVDQSYTRPDRECFQSWVTAYDVNPGDFTIGFFAGSHKSFEKFGKKFGVKKRDNNYKLQTQEEIDFYESKHRQIRVTCPKGAVVIWDSRVVHTGLEPVKGRLKPNFRTVCFLSYGPRKNVPVKTLERRVTIYKNRKATTHWAHKNVRTLSENNLKNSKLIKLKSNPPETKLMRNLIGYPLSVLELSPYNK